MSVPSFTDTLTLVSSVVVNCKTPASGAFVAWVKVGPDKIVTAWEQVETARTATVRDNTIARCRNGFFDSAFLRARPSRRWAVECTFGCQSCTPDQIVRTPGNRLADKQFETLCINI